MKLLANPVFIRMAAVLLSALAAFVIGVVAMRMLRRRMIEDGAILDSSGAEDALPLHTSAVIQQLKQQKFALQNEQQVERHRAKTSEHITAAIIAHLPCGVLFVAPNGLVRQANAAARQVLGFASPLGMSLSELLRDARVISESGSTLRVTDAFGDALHGKVGAREFDSRYFTPHNEERTLKFTLIPMDALSGEMLGLAAVISDASEMAELRQAQILRAEISAEMSLELRTSLSSIREWAGQISASTSPQRAQDLAEDISAEAERLDQSVGRFLAGQEKARAAEA